MTIAQSTTSDIATETCSVLAPTAPATAIEPDTPQTAPPVPSTAASRRSNPNRIAVR